MASAGTTDNVRVRRRILIGMTMLVACALHCGTALATSPGPPTLTAPADGSTATTPFPLAWSLPSAPVSGSVTLTLYPSSGGTPVVVTLVDQQSDSGTVNAASPLASPLLFSIVGATSIADGRYAAILSYRDSGSNTQYTAPVTTFTLDTHTLPPLITAPAPSASLSGPALAVTYTLPEAATAGSVTLTFVGSQTLTLTLGDSSAGSHTVTIDPLDPGSSADVQHVSGDASLLNASATYTVALAYQDALGNPAANTVTSWSYAYAPAAATTAPTQQTPSQQQPQPPPPAATLGLAAFKGPAALRTLATATARSRAARRACLVNHSFNAAELRICRARAALRRPAFTFTATAAETVVQAFTSGRRRLLSVQASAGAPGPVTVTLTTAQWRRLTRGTTRVTATVQGTTISANAAYRVT